MYRQHVAGQQSYPEVSIAKDDYTKLDLGRGQLGCCLPASFQVNMRMIYTIQGKQVASQ